MMLGSKTMTSEHSIHDSSGRQRVMYLQPAKSGAPLHAGLNTDVWRRGVYDPSSSSVRLDDGVTTTTIGRGSRRMMVLLPRANVRRSNI